MDRPEPKSVFHPTAWRRKRSGYTFVDRQYGRWGYILAWALGVPIPILLIIYLLPTPKGLPTMDELRHPVSGVFEEDLKRLKDSLEKLGAVPPGTRMPVHAAFGRIGHHAHGTLAHNHLDHHLKQFGV